jgi:hypothetical protein
VPEPTKFDVAQFAYGEVLDATKHQDDKIGRILTAIAFLTAGALVFAKPEAIYTIYRVGGDRFHLAAIFLGVFLFFDLLSVVLYILTMMTPLTYPGTVSGSRSHTSHIFFHVIAGTPKAQWNKLWDTGDIAATVQQELVDETYNLGRRAEQKNQRSRAASAFFLISILYLVPAVVLGVDTLSRSHGAAIAPMDWALARRFLVATPVALLVAVLILWAWLQAHAAIDDSDDDPADEDKKRQLQKDKDRSTSLAVLAFAYPVFIGAVIVSNGHRAWYDGLVLVLVVGMIATIALVWLYAATSGGEGTRPKTNPGPWISGLVGVAITAAAGTVVALAEPGLQLVVGMLAASLVLADNFIRVPFAPPAPPEAA